jgi:hypothetical protein
MASISSKDILKLFNKQLSDLLEEVCLLFPEYKDIKKAQSAMKILIKGNPKLTIMLWKEHVSNDYQTEILNGDVNFFLTKDYRKDAEKIEQGDQILSLVDKLREPMKNMGKENQNKTMKYIQNMTKLSLLYK